MVPFPRLLRPALGWLALAGALSAQSSIVLRDMSGPRGVVGQGAGGFTGPPFVPIAGALGRSCALMDANGDGFDDLLVGAPDLPTDPSQGVVDDAGHAYLLFGSPAMGTPSASPDVDFAALQTGQGIDFQGAAGDRVGASVAAAGDVNGDGVDDFVVGAPNRSLGGRTGAGGAYIVFGGTDLHTLASTQPLAALAADGAHRAVFLQGARALGSSGHSVSGAVDVDGDGLDDVILGAPLDSTGSLSSNGTASVVYGDATFPLQSVVDLASLGAGAVTVVHGSQDFQLVGFSVAGLGRFDRVLPMTNNQTDPVLGDDVAIGAPGTTPGASFFTGAVYVLRGDTGPSPAASYTTADFGNGPNTAGIVYAGEVAGDQAGLFVGRAGDLLDIGAGFDDLLVTAPFSNGPGKVASGTVYLLAGTFEGVDPQGFDLAQLGTCCPGSGDVRLQGAFNEDGLGGVVASPVGDWDDDGFTDLAIGYANGDYLDGGSIHLGAGRVAILDGQILNVTPGTMDLSLPPAGLNLATLYGETGGARVGAALAVGDLNGDGLDDLAVGAPEAPSDPDPGDVSGVAMSKTGRAHVVYGPLFRIESVTPSTSHFGGPTVTLVAHNVTVVNGLLVDGVSVALGTVVTGDPGSIEFEPPVPLAFGKLADLTVQLDQLNVLARDALQYETLALSADPAPAIGFGGRQVSLVGTAFSTALDTQVLVGGFPATIDSLDGLAGTMTITLPVGPTLGAAADLQILNSNGDLTVPGALTYTAFLFDSVDPPQGIQTSGVHHTNPSGSGNFLGDPAVNIDVTVLLAPGQPALDTNAVVEFGSDTLGWRTGDTTGAAGSVVSVDLPPFLLGQQDVLVDVRVTHNGFTVTGKDLFTYLASDFTEHAQYSKPGVAGTTVRVLAAGQMDHGGKLLLLLDGWPTDSTSLVALFFGFVLIDPPLPVKGGLFPIDLTAGFLTFAFGSPFTSLPAIAVSDVLDNPLDPQLDGMSVFVHVITREQQLGGNEVWGFSDLLEMTITLSD